MTERPIIFSTDMVRAIINGRKTVTRRILKPQPEELIDTTVVDDWEIGGVLESSDEFEIRVPGSYEWLADIKNVYGHVDDLLWVRETFKQVSHYAFFDDVIFQFRADGKTTMPQLNHPEADVDQLIDMSAWKPSIHMHKSIARIWLQIQNLRIERLHNITQEDAINEGIEVFKSDDGLVGNRFRDYLASDDPMDWFLRPRDSFESLWAKIHAQDSWDLNPWVWVIKFKVLSTTGKPQVKEMEVANG